MAIKIKEFKGSLTSIFDEQVNNHQIEKVTYGKEHITNGQLPIGCIKPKDGQPRKIFNDESLEELAQSIKSKGVIQPIVVKPTGDQCYEIIVGERRWRAAKRVGLETIPAVVHHYNKIDSMAVALIENIQRENLNPIEEAEALRYLMKEGAMTHHQVAQSIGRSRASITNFVRLLDLTEEVKSMVKAGLLEMGHARAILSLDHDKQIEAANLIIHKSLSVREAEKLVRVMNTKNTPPTASVDFVFEKKAQEWQANLSKQLSSKVNVSFNPEGKGKILIHFESVKEAEWLMERIKITEQ